ncbi:hypothetical protein AKJ16_DCAP18932 [Drosera capensis]
MERVGCGLLLPSAISSYSKMFAAMTIPFVCKIPEVAMVTEPSLPVEVSDDNKRNIEIQSCPSRIIVGTFSVYSVYGCQRDSAIYMKKGYYPVSIFWTYRFRHGLLHCNMAVIWRSGRVGVVKLKIKSRRSLIAMSDSSLHDSDSKSPPSSSSDDSSPSEPPDPSSPPPDSPSGLSPPPPSAPPT